MSKNFKILSFDPASKKNVGWSIVSFVQTEKDFQLDAVNGGTFVTNHIEPWQTLWPVFQFADSVINFHKPDYIVMEKTSSFSGGFVTGQVSNCMGAILAACGKHNSKVSFVFPTHVKKVVTGKGKATKTMMKRSVSSFVLKYLNITLKLDSDHAYDALGNIICWLTDSGYLVGENNET